MMSRRDRLDKFRRRGRTLTTQKRSVAQDQPPIAQALNCPTKSLTTSTSNYSKSICQNRDVLQTENSNKVFETKGSLKERVAAFQRQHSNKSFSQATPNNNGQQNLKPLTSLPLREPGTRYGSKDKCPQRNIVGGNNRNLVTRIQSVKENWTSLQNIQNGATDDRKYTPRGTPTKNLRTPIVEKGGTYDQTLPSFADDRKHASWKTRTKNPQAPIIDKGGIRQILSSVTDDRKNDSCRTPTRSQRVPIVDKGGDHDQILSSVTHDRNHSWTTPTKSPRALTVDKGVARGQVLSYVPSDRKHASWRTPTRNQGAPTVDKVAFRDQTLSSVTKNRKHASRRIPTKIPCTSVVDIGALRDQILLNKAGDRSSDEVLADNDIDDSKSAFSFANLHSMWLQRDTQPMEIKPPTATTPLQYQTPSPASNKISSRKCISYPPGKKIIDTSKADNSSEYSSNAEVSDTLVKSNANDSSDVKDFNNLSSGKSLIMEDNLDLEVTKVCIEEESDIGSRTSLRSTSPQKDIIDKELRNEKEVDGSLNDFKFCFNEETRMIEDPYMNFDSMSTAYSEATTQVKNISCQENQDFLDLDESIGNSVTSNTVRKTVSHNELSRKKKMKKVNHFDNLEDHLELDTDQESDSNIPDSAFELDKDGRDVINPGVYDVVQNTNSCNKVRWASEHSKAHHFDSTDDYFEEDSTIPDSAFELYTGRQNITNASKPLTAVSISELSETLSSDRPTSIAGSDVFDGLSEIASSINLSFARRAAPNSTNSLLDKKKGGETLTMRSENRAMNQSEAERINYAEDSEYVHKAWKSNFTSSELETQSRENAAIITRKRIQAEPIEDDAIITRSLSESGGQTRSNSLEDTDDQSTYGISPISNVDDSNDSFRSNQDQLSFHLQILTTESPLKNDVNSITNHHDKKNKSEVESFDVSIGDLEAGSTESKSSVKYPLVREESPDTLSSVRWVPSMIRLYGEKIANDVIEDLQGSNTLKNRAGRKSTPFNRRDPKVSPSTVDKFSHGIDDFDNKPTLSNINGNQSSVLSNLKHFTCDSKYEIAGIQTINLYKNDVFGGIIEDPSSLVCNALEKQDLNLPTEELDYPQSERLKRRLGHSQGKKRSMPEEAMEIHSNAEAYLESKQVEDAMELYENFLEEKNNFQAVDKQTENQVVGAFLHNIGILHVMVGDFDLSVNFLSQAVSYRHDGTSGNGVNSREIAVTLNEMGIAHFASGQYEDALKVFADALSIWQNIDSDESYQMTKVLNNIGCTYFVLNEIDAAIEAMSEALEIQRSFLIKSIVKKMNCSSNIATAVKTSLLGVSEIMCNMAHLFFFTKSMEEARFLLDKAALIHTTLFGGHCRKELLRLETTLSSASSSRPR